MKSTMNTELIAELRSAAWAGPVPCPVCDKAADALEAAQAENALLTMRWEKCTEFAKQVEEARDAALARLAELSKQEPVAYFDVCVNGDVGAVRFIPHHGEPLKSGDMLYAAAGASSEPSPAQRSIVPLELSQQWDAEVAKINELKDDDQLVPDNFGDIQVQMICQRAADWGRAQAMQPSQAVEKCWKCKPYRDACGELVLPLCRCKVAQPSRGVGLSDEESARLLEQSDLLDMHRHIGWYSAPERSFKKHGMALIKAVIAAINAKDTK